MKKPKIKISNINHVKDLAKQMKIKINKAQKALKELGIIKDILDKEETVYLLEMLGYEFITQKTLKEKIDNKNILCPRHAIVGIVGHVDHGKTSILDAIRKSNIAKREAGGITQHINSYVISWKKDKITFIDTPGHEAFLNMRQRGVQVTDIVLLVISAIDGISNQTIESINHIKNNKSNFIVVLNKCDLPNANPSLVEQQLLKYNIIVENMGGDILSVHCSAKTGKNIDILLDTILLYVEILNLTAQTSGNARGIVLESILDKHKGVIVHALVLSGLLKVKDCCVIHDQISRIRLIKDDIGSIISEAGPSTPVEIWGFNKAPKPGSEIIIVHNEMEGRTLIKEETKLSSEQNILSTHSDDKKILRFLIKCDAHGSIEAITNVISCYNQVLIDIVRSGVGPVTSSDLELANLTDAMILNFHNSVSSAIQKQADIMNVVICSSNVIYTLLDVVNSEVNKLIKPEIEDAILGKAEILKIFYFPKVGSVVGCIVREGIFTKGNKIKIIDKAEEIIFKGKINNIQKERENIENAREGVECGIALGKVKLPENVNYIIAYEQK